MSDVLMPNEREGLPKFGRTDNFEDALSPARRDGSVAHCKDGIEGRDGCSRKPSGLNVRPIAVEGDRPVGSG